MTDEELLLALCIYEEQLDDPAGRFALFLSKR